MSVTSRIRPAPDHATSPPPNKRRKTSPDARQNGFSSILLNNKSGKPLAPAYTTQKKRLETAKVNDVNAVISTSNGLDDVQVPTKQEPELVEISSDSSSDDDDEDADVNMENGVVEGEANGVIDDDKVWDEAFISKGKRALSEDAEGEGAEDMTTFGDKLHTAEPIDVESALAKIEEDSSDDVRRSHARQLTIPSANTLGTVLTQALRTNDKDLLETCFDMNDLEGVRETISRLESKFVTTLLSRIAERISSRPGRLGNLMVWVQWSIVAHGGYLAGQPAVMAKMATLIRVIKERANGLQPLLQLKGKLDMLQAQLDLRRSEQARNQDEDFEEESVTIYQEGEDDVLSEDVEGKLIPLEIKGIEDSDDDESDAGAFATGLVKADESDEESSAEEEGLFDEEAEETDDDEGDEDEEEEADDDMDSD